ncbi:MAG: 4-(cytidine 5'-diphospho)-2-C-methyl-D-erythritol kinase [Pelagibacterales bacterium MED-G42]|nr:MAG: 4-(cytidine 5'-diphospho)-2-C-methyl-D-erythritol kinase [Pelagibacterales bacterium MED-G42]|tara:strand:- start:2084 stop:2929 length:846 start_codon:yes stop_codon:yes gene_type:complete
MNIHKIKSFAKINLALNVIGKIKNLHKIESIFSFINLYDLILIKKISSPKHKIFFCGKFSSNIKKVNTVTKLLDILDKKKLLKNNKFYIKIKKNIPQKSGLGGGSMNAANILNFLHKRKFINVSQKQIIKISKLVGSDVNLGLESTSGIINSKGIIKRFDNSPKFFILLTKPVFGCSTKKIYSKVKKFTKSKYNSPKKSMFSQKYLKSQKNDLEKIAFFSYFKLQKIKNFLMNSSNPLFVRMTGSGSVIVAYYLSNLDSVIAKARFKRKFKNYWCITSKTI